MIDLIYHTPDQAVFPRVCLLCTVRGGVRGAVWGCVPYDMICATLGIFSLEGKQNVQTLLKAKLE